MRRLSLIVAAMVLAGCYTLQPLSTASAPVVGMELALELTDGGRVALTPLMGPDVDLVQGVLLERDTSSYLLAVSQVRLLRSAGVQLWSAEKVRIEVAHVRSLSERRLSRARSLIAGAAGVGGLAYISTRGLLGFGFGDDDVPSDTGEQLIRVIWPE